MDFENITQEQWTEMVNQQLKDKSIEDYSQMLEEDVNVLPYYSEQDFSEGPLFENETVFLGNVKYQDPYSENYYGEIQDFLDENINTGFLKVNTLSDLIEVEENMPGNTFTYWLDLFYKFETESNYKLDLEEHESNWDTLNDKVQDKVKFIINVDLHQNCGAQITEQVGLAMSKLNELVSYFSPAILNQIAFRVAIGDKYLIEIAKLRALRMAFKNFIEVFRMPDVDIQIIAQSSSLNKTKEESENNLVRATLEISAAVLGGADYCLIEPYKQEDNEEWANDVSLKQGLILSHEALLNYFNDALAGSFLIEKLSYAIGEKSWELFQNTEKKGGYSDDFDEIVRDIYAQLKQHIQNINLGKFVIIGYNKYGSKEFQEIKVPKPSPVLVPFTLP